MEIPLPPTFPGRFWVKYSFFKLIISLIIDTSFLKQDIAYKITKEFNG